MVLSEKDPNKRDILLEEDMRIKKKKNGTRRIKSGFLIFPKTINGETRWLESATWIEYYYSKNGWVSSQWLESE